VGTVELEKRDGNSTGHLPRMERDAMIGLVKVGGTPEQEYCYNGFWLLAPEQVSSPYVFDMIIIVLWVIRKNVDSQVGQKYSKIIYRREIQTFILK
jgi:hypothetical protein